MSTPKEIASKLHLLGNEQDAIVHAADAVHNSEAVSGGDILLVPSRSLTQLSINQDLSAEAPHPKTSHDAEQQRDYDYRALADDDANILAAPEIPDAKGRQEKLSERVQTALLALGIEEQELKDLGIDLNSLNELISKELGCTHYLRWAAVDNIIEKLIQGLMISKEDLKPAKELRFPILKQLARHMPHGRSIPLQQDWGIKKVQASRSIVQTTEQILINGVQLFIAVALSYRLYELAVKGSSDFGEFSGVFEANSQKGISGLVHALAKVDKTWLQLLLASPAIIGVIKGLWDGYQTGTLNSLDLIKIQTAVQEHIQPLQSIKQKLASYLWQDTLFQLIPLPVVTTVSEYCQKAERIIRWDGRITLAQRAMLFNHVQQLALRGRALSKITAMQSMAKISHSFSIQDFAILRAAGHEKATIVQLLKIKATALQNIKKLIRQSDRHSIPTIIYAHYLLWWLGMRSIKSTAIFLSYKAIVLSLEILFIKEIIDSILEAIRCPDKPGFRMFYGDYEVWANDLTLDCFREFVRQFRLISKEEAFQPFLEQLQNFHLQDVDAIDLTDKALTSNETRAVLQVLNQKMQLKYLNLSFNLIDETQNLIFSNGLLELNLGNNRITSMGAQQLILPNSLQLLDLRVNQIGSRAKALSLPQGLQSLYLGFNQIGPDGAKALSLPPSLQFLDLGDNQIGADGAKALSLPQSLQSLFLGGNQIGKDVQGLDLPLKLKMLNLAGNIIGDEGARELKLPPYLQHLNLVGNRIGNEGAQNLKLPTSLQELILFHNYLDEQGVVGLKLPLNLQYLDLAFNRIGPNVHQFNLPSQLAVLGLGGNPIGPLGVKRLKFPPTLKTLFLYGTQIGPNGTQGLEFPPNLEELALDVNQLGPQGIKGLKLPANLLGLNLGANQIGEEGEIASILPRNLQVLYMRSNNIGLEGARKLKLPDSLQILDLWNNNLGSKGTKALSLPSNLQSLGLKFNQIAPEGIKGLTLPPRLQFLDLSENQIGSEGVKYLSLPTSLRRLDLSANQIDDAGIKTILRKISQTQLTYIDLDGNQYNASEINVDRVLQQQILLRYCKDKLCHANTPLQSDDPLQAKLQQSQGKQIQPFKVQQKLLQNQLPQDHLNQPNHELQISTAEESHTSGAPRKTPCLFFSWMKKPLQSLKDQADACVTSTINSIGARLRNVLSDCPSYFPNIHSQVFHDHHPPGPLMFSQFKSDYDLVNRTSIHSITLTSTTFYSLTN